MSVFFRRRGKAAELVTGKMLGDYAQGDTVYINENGSPVAFYVAKHDYESGLNGAGRTALLRSSTIGIYPINSSGVNEYAGGEVDAFLNGDYLARFSPAARSLIGKTSFKYTTSENASAGNNTTTVLERAVFLPALNEVREGSLMSPPVNNNEGTYMGLPSTITNALLSSIPNAAWTRSPCLTTSQSMLYWTSAGLNSGNPDKRRENFPMLTLSAKAVFDEATNVWKEK